MKYLRNFINNRWSLLSTLSVVLIALTFSCAKKDPEVIKIGVILPLTGPGASYGTQVLDGIKLAQHDLINSNTISSERVKLIIEDSQTEVSKGINALHKLKNINNVQFVIGALASSVTLACAPYAEENKILLLSPGSSSNDISNAGDYIFRIAPKDSYDGEFLAKSIFLDYSILNVSIIYLNNDFGIGLKESFVKSYSKLGGNIVMSESFEMGTNDFRTLITKILGNNFEALLLIAAGQENILALKQLHELGYEGQIFCPSTFNDPKLVKLAGNTAEGLIFSANSFEGIKNQIKVKEFFTNYYSFYPGKEPTTFTAYGYDSFTILIEQILIDGYNSTKVKNSLYRIDSFYGASGKTEFDENGDALKELTLFIVRNGVAEPILKEDPK